MTKLNIDDLTLGQLKEIQKLSNDKQGGSHPFEIGKSYFIRTVTMSLVGRLKAVFETELVLEGASWVADSGRFSNALKEGLEDNSSSEIEPFPNDVIVGRGSIVDATEFCHKLPKEQK